MLVITVALATLIVAIGSSVVVALLLVRRRLCTLEQQTICAQHEIHRRWPGLKLYALPPHARGRKYRVAALMPSGWLVIGAGDSFDRAIAVVSAVETLTSGCGVSLAQLIVNMALADGEVHA